MSPLQVCSFIILSILVIANENLMFIYATSNFVSYVFVIATVSSLYNIAGLTTHSLLFLKKKKNLSQITPDTLLHPLNPTCTISGTEVHFCTRQLQLIALYLKPTIFEIVHLYQLCSLQHHLPTVLSFITHIYLFSYLFSYLVI